MRVSHGDRPVPGSQFWRDPIQPWERGFLNQWHMKRDRFWLLLSSAWLLAAIGLIVLFI
jgi:hypothetical protein